MCKISSLLFILCDIPKLVHFMVLTPLHVNNPQTSLLDFIRKSKVRFLISLFSSLVYQDESR